MYTRKKIEDVGSQRFLAFGRAVRSFLSSRFVLEDRKARTNSIFTYVLKYSLIAVCWLRWQTSYQRIAFSAVIFDAYLID